MTDTFTTQIQLHSKPGNQATSFGVHNQNTNFSTQGMDCSYQQLVTLQLEGLQKSDLVM